MENMSDVPEKIVCAACKYEESVIFAGVRHFDVIMHNQIAMAFDEKYWAAAATDMEQGFLTNKYRFVTREEAWIIAEREGQILRDCGNPNSKQLFSENLY